MDPITIDLNNYCLERVNFDDDDPESIIHIWIIFLCNRYKPQKACKKDIIKELTAAT